MRCNYCGQPYSTDKPLNETRCPTCGAPVDPKPAAVDRGYVSDRFAYNGYIVYTMYDPASRSVEYQWWLGDRLLERFAFSRDLLDDLVPPYEDCMPLLWSLFEMSQGRQDTVEIARMNERKQIRRLRISVEPEDGQPPYRSLSEIELYQAVHR